MDFFGGFVQRDKAAQGHKVKGVDGQRAAGAGELTQSAVGVQADGDVRPGQHFKLACTVVDDDVRVAAGAGNAPVDFYVQIGGAGRQAFNAYQGDFTCLGVEGTELAGGGRAALWQYFGHERQSKVHLGQAQAQSVCCAAIDTGEGVYAGGTDGEHVCADFCGFFGLGGVFADDTVVEDEAFGLLLQRKGTGNLHKAKGINVQVGAGSEQSALRAVHVHGDAAVGTCGNQDGALAGGGVSPLCVFGETVVQHRVGQTRGAGSAVDADGDGVSTGGEAFYAHQGCAVSTGFEAGPTARCLAGGDVTLA